MGRTWSGCCLQAWEVPCDKETGDWKDIQTCDQLSQRICALNPCWLYLSLFSPLDAMVRAFLECHILLIVAGPRDSPAWNPPSVRRLRGQFYEC